MNPRLFNRYYDLLYADKDYAAEVIVVSQILSNAAPWDVTRLLEVGCGTGSHSLEFARLGYSVCAVDLDADAIAVAEGRSALVPQPPRFTCIPVSDLTERDFDGAVSLFNVVNYILDERELVQLFRGVLDHLRLGGVFVFDSWNGQAAIADPPRQKSSEIVRNRRRATIHIDPKNDLAACLVKLHMRIEIEDEDLDHPIRFDHDIVHRLWTPLEICDLLEQCGFSCPGPLRWMSPDRPAAADDWKIMFVCQRPEA